LGWVSKEPNSDELLIEPVYRLCEETTEFDTNSERILPYRYFRLSWVLGFDDFRSLSYRGDRARYIYAETIQLVCISDFLTCLRLVREFLA
jgi:hypothetical protein